MGYHLYRKLHVVDSMKRPSVDRFSKSVQDLYKGNRFVVFLCGPALKDAETNSGSALRLRLRDELEADGYEVVLGEDEGLEDVRVSVTKGYAHDNELEFISRECSAIVIVAGSVGSFCELGLFVHWLARNDDRTCDLILLADKLYENDRSYFNEGPARAADDFGKTLFVDFATADLTPVLRRIAGRRSTHFFDGRGRPPSSPIP
ncbi:MAG: hypothetical protein K5880_05275 [Hydrogenophaga sp.]|uniref:hypothetical protein n=1 Tax=Hydrogenophaga sp. TaxID=1904254 RepID=UPI002629C192|nr:hypothetical protein [Hydrogenophaga sp.]MCV0438020.1 hypothetical protein [Hydrogenophaga sp.]